MAKRPSKKRPTDVVGNAVHVMRIATGEIADTPPPQKNPAAVELGRLGGLKGGAARKNALSARQRKTAAKKAAAARWKKKT